MSNWSIYMNYDYHVDPNCEYRHVPANTSSQSKTRNMINRLKMTPEQIQPISLHLDPQRPKAAWANGWEPTNFDRRSSAQTWNYGLVSTRTTAGGTPFGPQQAGHTGNIPFDYRQLHTMFSVPASESLFSADAVTSPEYITEAASVIDSTSLQDRLDVTFSPMIDEEDEEDEETVMGEPSPEPQTKRKRGRPKLNRRESGSSSSKNTQRQRIPHNQVERKYRENLNIEMERLRVNIPLLPQHNSDSLATPPKPSKAAVLAAAVEYITWLEAEIKRLVSENERLKSRRDGKGMFEPSPSIYEPMSDST